LSVSLISKLQPANNINYRSSFVLYFQRTTLKILEVWRSISSTFQSFFRNSANKIEKGNLLRSSDILENIKNTKNLGYVDLQIINQKINKESIINNNEKPIIFLPYTISGYIRDHIVFFAVNKITEEIIFYDSKGWSLADYGLEETFDIIKENYPEFRFVQNTKKEQYDAFNCGVYVLKRIIKLDEEPNISFEELLEQNPMSYGEAMKARRDGSIQTLSQSYFS